MGVVIQQDMMVVVDMMKQVGTLILVDIPVLDVAEHCSEQAALDSKDLLQVAGSLVRNKVSAVVGVNTHARAIHDNFHMRKLAG